MMVKLVSQSDEGDDESEDDDVYEDEDNFDRDNAQASKVFVSSKWPPCVPGFLREALFARVRQSKSPEPSLLKNINEHKRWVKRVREEANIFCQVTCSF